MYVNVCNAWKNGKNVCKNVGKNVCKNVRKNYVKKNVRLSGKTKKRETHVFRNTR